MDILEHVRQNFELYGFISEKSAIWQTMRELVENGKDAIEKRISSESTSNCIPSTNPTIRIVMKNDLESPNEIKIEILDDGFGMDDPLTCMRCFYGSRAFDEAHVRVEDMDIESQHAQLIGKYGIGLSACVLYSQLTAVNGDGTTRIITKTSAQEEAFVADFKFNTETGEPIIVRSVRVFSRPRVGTRM